MSAKTQSHNPYRGKRKALLHTMLDSDNMDLSVVDLCKKAKVSQRIYYTYTQEEKFNQALKDQVIRLYARHLPQSANRLAKLAKQGDMKALKLLHEALDLAGNRYTQTVNIANQQAPLEELQATTPEELALILNEKIQELQAMLAQVQGKRIQTATSTMIEAENATPCHTQPESHDTPVKP